jgi:hypothetical protein
LKDLKMRRAEGEEKEGDALFQGKIWGKPERSESSRE